MCQKISIFFLLLSLPMACKKAEPTSSKKESVTEQPTEVSGGFGLTMQCSVMNREVPNATSAEIGCIVSNNDGSKFNGNMKDLKAAVTAKGRTDAILGEPQTISGSATVNVSLKVEGLAPSDALSIEVSGKFDEKPAVLAATLKGRFALICDDDVTYYVTAEASETNLACTEKEPCKTISKAIALLPDVFNCAVTIKVAGGNNPGSNLVYQEQIKISGRQVTDKAALKILGVSVVDGIFTNAKPASFPVIQPQDPLVPAEEPVSGQLIPRTGVTIRAFGTETANVTLENITIDGTESSTLGNSSKEPLVEVQKQLQNEETPASHFEVGLLAESSFVILKRVNFKNFREIAVRARNSSRLHMETSNIESSLAGVDVTDSFKISFKGETTISGPNLGDTDPATPVYIESEKSFGIKAARTVFASYEDTILAITGVRTGISLYQSRTELQTRSKFLVSNVHTGLKLEQGAEWNWHPKLLSFSDNFQPTLSLDICYYTCIDADNSTFVMETDAPTKSDQILSEFYRNRVRPRLKLNGIARQSSRPDIQDVTKQLNAENNDEISLPQFRHRGLIKSSKSGVTISFLENLWCDRPNDSNNSGGTHAVFIDENNKLVMKVTEIDKQHGCAAAGTMLVKELFKPDYSSNGTIEPRQYTLLRLSYDDSVNDYSFNKITDSNNSGILYEFDAVLIWPYTYHSSTAGGDPLEIFTANFQSEPTVTIGGIPAPVLDFNPNFEPGKQRLLVKPSPHNPTSHLPSDQKVEVIVTGLSRSLAEPGQVSVGLRNVEYGTACPNNYMEVPFNSDLGTETFCVMSFEAKDFNGQAVSQPEGAPITNISRDGASGAISKCDAISPYHSLISNAQWQALAEYTAAPVQDNFWNYDNFGTGIPIGHSDNEPAAPQAASSSPGSGYECFNTGINAGDSAVGSCQYGRSQEPQARYFYDSGTDLWDFAGNAAEWVADDFTHTGISTSNNYASQFSPGANIFSPRTDNSSYNTGIYGGFGYIKQDAPAGTYGIARGGSYLDGDKSGVFAADATLDPTAGYPNVGFRCVVVPPQTVP